MSEGASKPGQALSCDTPSPFFWAFPPWSMRSGRAIQTYNPPPKKRGISAMLARYHMKTSQMGAISKRYCAVLDKKYDPKRFKTRQFGSLGPYVCSYFCLVCEGWGRKKNLCLNGLRLS